MKEYRFYLYLTFNGETTGEFHSVFAKSYQQAYHSLLAEVPHNFSYDSFVVNPRYRVNGKIRTAK